MADWATHNKCQSGPSKKNIGDTTRLVWSDCANSADIDFYRTKGGGHTWPGSSELVAAFLENSLGKTTQAVNASELMWEFFSQYRLATYSPLASCAAAGVRSYGLHIPD